MADEAYFRLGDAVWARFRAMGVAEPATQTLAFFRDPSHEWLSEPGEVDLTRLMLESTRWALPLASVSPVAAAVSVFPSTVRRILAIRNEESALLDALFLCELDGFDTDTAAQLVGTSASGLRRVEAAVSDRLADLPLSSSMTGDGHLSTLDLHGFVLESLDTLKVQQIENHLSGCESCLHRFEAWAQNQLDFAALPPPLPPPRPSVFRTGAPALLGLMGLLALGAGAGVLLWAVQSDSSSSSGELAVELRVGDRLVTGEVPIGTPISVSFDGSSVSHYGLARINDGRVEPVLTGRTQPEGRTQIPVELLVTTATHQAVLVVFADRELAKEELIAPGEDTLVMEVPLRVSK